MTVPANPTGPIVIPAFPASPLYPVALLQPPPFRPPPIFVEAIGRQTTVPPHPDALVWLPYGTNVDAYRTYPLRVVTAVGQDVINNDPGHYPQNPVATGRDLGRVQGEVTGSASYDGLAINRGINWSAWQAITEVYVSDVEDPRDGRTIAVRRDLNNSLVYLYTNYRSGDTIVGSGVDTYANAAAKFPASVNLALIAKYLNLVAAGDPRDFSISISDRFTGQGVTSYWRYGLFSWTPANPASDIPALLAPTTWYVQYLLRTTTALADYALFQYGGAAIGIGNSLLASYNAAAGTVVAAYTAQRNALNSNPIMQNPGGSAITAVNGAVAMVMAQVAAVSKLATDTLTFVTNTIGAIKTGTVDPLQAQLMKAVTDNAAFVGTVVTNTTKTVTDTANNTLAEIERQRAILEAEAERQRKAGEAAVTAIQAEAMRQIGNASAVLLSTLGTVTAIVTKAAGDAVELALRTQAQVQQQAADRPLFYGPLSAPVSVSTTADVIVIPPGGLIVTAD